MKITFGEKRGVPKQLLIFYLKGTGVLDFVANVWLVLRHMMKRPCSAASRKHSGLIHEVFRK